MKIDIKDYLMEYIGDIDWYGESYHDGQSLKNIDKAEKVLDFLEEVKDEIINNLAKHRVYRKENASAADLHNKARKILFKHKVQTGELSVVSFKEWFGDSDE